MSSLVQLGDGRAVCQGTSRSPLDNDNKLEGLEATWRGMWC